MTRVTHNLYRIQTMQRNAIVRDETRRLYVEKNGAAVLAAIEGVRLTTHLSR